MTTVDREQLAELVAEIRKYTTDLDRMDNEIGKAIPKLGGTQKIAQKIGRFATAAILAYLGNPTEYSSAPALEKAAGMNLKVRSSGKDAGQLKITKRGPGIVRRALHLAALRLIQEDAVVHTWYMGRSSFKADLKLKAVTAVSRKLIRAVWHMAKNDEPFDSFKLFDTRRLKLPDSPEKERPRGFANRRLSAVESPKTSESMAVCA